MVARRPPKGWRFQYLFQYIQHVFQLLVCNHQRRQQPDDVWPGLEDKDASFEQLFEVGLYMAAEFDAE